MRVSATRIIVCALALASVACEAPSNAQVLQITRVDHYKETKQYLPEPVDRISVVLSNGRTLKVPLYAANAIAILTGSDGSHFLLAEGSNCTMCDEARTIRLFLIGPGDLEATEKRYTYPGTLKEFMSDELVQKTRVFYGRCADEPGDVVVWISDYIGKDAKWHHGSEIARLAKTGEALVEDAHVSLESVLEHVAAHRCTELPGVEGTTEP